MWVQRVSTMPQHQSTEAAEMIIMTSVESVMMYHDNF